jgi:hypothetical protein
MPAVWKMTKIGLLADHVLGLLEQKGFERESSSNKSDSSNKLNKETEAKDKPSLAEKIKAKLHRN